MAQPLVEVVIAGNSESYTASVNSAAGVTEDAVGRLDTASKGLSTAMDSSAGSADALGASMREAGGVADTTAEQFTTSSEDIGKSIESLFTLTDELGLSYEKTAGMWDAAAATTIADTQDIILEMDKLIESVGKVDGSVDDMGGTIDTTSESSSGALSTIGDMLERLEGKFGIVGEAAAKMGASIKESCEVADESLASTDEAAKTTAGGIGIVGKASIVAGVVVAAAAVDMGAKYQALTTNIAAWGGISVASATKITNSFLDTAGSTIYSGKEIATAYGAVVGQLTAVEGHALNSNQALTVMKSAMDLAEGSGESLSTATSALATVMQTYQIKTSGATKASDELFSTSKGSGVALSAVAKSVQQVHTQLGGLTPPLGQTGALLVDMVEHGMNGSRAMRVLGTSLNSLLKPSEDVIDAQKNLKTTSDALPPSLQKLATEYKNGTITALQATTAAEGLGTQQAQLWSNFTSADTAVTSANLKLKESGDAALFVNGKFVGLGKAIGILHDQTKGLDTQQKLAKLAQDGLASSAAKLLPIINAGSKSFEKSQEEVTKAGAAHAAAAKQAQTLDHQIELVKVAVEDWVTKLGVVLVPVLMNVAKVLISVTKWLLDHKIILLAVAGAVVGFLVPAFIAWATAAAAAAVASIAAAAPFIAIGVAVAALGYGIYELVKHWGEVWSKIKSIADDAWKFIHNDIIEPIEHGFDWLITEIKAHWQGLLEILIAPFAPVLAIVMAFHTQIINFFEQIPAAVQRVVNDIVGFFTGMGSQILGAVQQVVGFFSALPGEIVGALGDLVQTIFGGLLSAGTWINANVIQPVLNYFIQLPSKIFGYLSNIVGVIFADLRNAGTWVNTNVIQPVVGFFAGLPEQIKKAIGSLFDDGVNIIKGLWDGISSVGSWLYGQISGFVKSFVEDPIKSFFHMFSPSRLMAGHGMNIGLGLAQGILASAGAVGAASQSIANAALGNIGNLSSGAGITSIGTATGSGSSSGGGGAPITLVLSIDGQQFAQAILSPLQSVALRNQKTGGQFTINLGS